MHTLPYFLHFPYLPNFPYLLKDVFTVHIQTNMRRGQKNNEPLKKQKFTPYWSIFLHLYRMSRKTLYAFHLAISRPVIPSAVQNCTRFSNVLPSYKENTDRGTKQNPTKFMFDRGIFL